MIAVGRQVWTRMFRSLRIQPQARCFAGVDHVDKRKSLWFPGLLHTSCPHARTLPCQRKLRGALGTRMSRARFRRDQRSELEQNSTEFFFFYSENTSCNGRIKHCDAKDPSIINGVKFLFAPYRYHANHSHCCSAFTENS